MSKLSLYDIKRLLKPYQSAIPTDDFRIIDSWVEYDENDNSSIEEKPLEYMCYELETINPDTGEVHHFYKALKFVRIIRLPKNAKQSTAFMDMQAQILSGIYEEAVNFVTVVANIKNPVPLGLLYLYGVQGVGKSIDEAKEQAHYDFLRVIGMLQGTFRVLEMRVLNAQETEWLRNKMYGMEFMTVVRGIPKASKSGEDAGNKGFGGSNLNPDSQGTLEELIIGLTDYEYVLEILSTPVQMNTLKAWSLKTQTEMTDWYTQLQGQTSLSANISIPMMYGANAGTSSGWSQAYTDADSITYSQSESFTTSEGVSLSESLSQSFGTTESQSFGITNSESYGVTEGITHGITEGTTHGISEGVSVGTSDGTSLGISQSNSNSTGVSQGMSTNSSMSESLSNSVTNTENTSISNSVGESHSLSHSLGSTETHSTTNSVGTSNTMSSSEGKTDSSSFNVSDSTSTNLSNGYSTSSSHSLSEGLSKTETNSASNSTNYGYSHSEGYNEGNTEQSAGSNVLNIFGFDPDGKDSWGYSESDTVSGGTSSSNSHSESTSNSITQSDSTSSSNSYGLSQGTGHSVSSGGSTGTSHNQSVSQGSTESSSIGNSQAASETYSTSDGQTLTSSFSAGQSISQGISNSQSISNGYGESISLSDSNSYSEGVNQSVSNSVNKSENYSTSDSTSNSVSQSVSQSVSNTTSQSVSNTTSHSVSNTTSKGTTSGTSSSISNGTSTGESKGQSFSSSNGTSGTVSSGISSSLGLGPSIGWSKSHQWINQQVKDILELLEFQNERAKKALRGNGAFYTYVYLACSDMDALATAQAVAKSTWQNEFAMVSPLQVLSLDMDEQKHLLYHFSAFSTDITKELVEGKEEYKYATILLSDEMTAYTHLPRVSEGGVFADIDDIPKFAVPSMLKGEIYMGTVISSEKWSIKKGNRTDFDYRINESELMHGFITGASRSGKTVAAMRFIAELANIKRKSSGKRLRIVCMDPKQDWRGLVRFVEPERFNFWSLGNLNFRPIKLNPWKIPRGVQPQIWIDGVIDIYCRAYGLLERGKQMMGETIYALYEEAGVFKACEDENWKDIVPELSRQVNFSRIQDSMEKKRDFLESSANTKGRMGNDTRDAYSRLLERMSAFKRPFSIEHIMFGTSDGMGIDELIGADDVTVLESKGLENTFKNFIFGVITSGFYKYALAHEHGYLAPDQYETVLVIEEANEVLTGSDTAGSAGSGQVSLSGQSEFEQILDQSAGYGLFIFAITQKIADMPSSVIANSGIKFEGKLSRPEDVTVAVRAIAREDKFEDRDIVKWFPRSPKGWFICQSSNGYDFKTAEPVLVNIAQLNMKTPSNAELEEILVTKEAKIKAAY